MSNIVQPENDNDNRHSQQNNDLNHADGSGQNRVSKNEGSTALLRPDKLPLKSVKVYSPQVKESMMSSYVLYKVGFIWSDKEFEVTRRYSDFKALREALFNRLPFTFIFPMHRNQLIVV